MLLRHKSVMKKIFLFAVLFGMHLGYGMEITKEKEELTEKMFDGLTEQEQKELIKGMLKKIEEKDRWWAYPDVASLKEQKEFKSFFDEDAL
jgi:hypothetical protein